MLEPKSRIIVDTVTVVDTNCILRLHLPGIAAFGAALFIALEDSGFAVAELPASGSEGCNRCGSSRAANSWVRGCEYTSSSERLEGRKLRGIGSSLEEGKEEKNNELIDQLFYLASLALRATVGSRHTYLHSGGQVYPAVRDRAS